MTESFLHLLRSSAKRAFRAARSLFERPPGSDLYLGWLDNEMKTRIADYPLEGTPARFSILTAVYEKTHAGYFDKTARSVLRQTYSDFEWIVLAHGPVTSEIRSRLENLSKDPRVRLLLLEQNLGIIGGMKHCLAAAAGDYVVPLDADDLMTDDALRTFASVIQKRGDPEFLYSDEDHLIGEVLQAPYIRPDWDPILNLSSSFVWHLTAFRRDLARSLQIYEDSKSNWCHDWDSLFRFQDAGIVPVHVPEILYHWRQHPVSSTNRKDPEKGSLTSQRHVLRLQVQKRADPDLYSVEPFPINRGAVEYWIRRKETAQSEMALVLIGAEGNQLRESLRALAAPDVRPYEVVYVPESRDRVKLQDEFRNLILKPVGGHGIAGLRAAAEQAQSPVLVVLSGGTIPTGSYWPYEALCLFEFHSDLALISGKVVGPDRKIIAGGEIFGFGRLIASPMGGASEFDPGAFALALKPHSVSGVDSSFFIGTTAFLRTALHEIGSAASWQGLGAWLGAQAKLQKQRVGYSPLISALRPTPPPGLSEEEISKFRRSHSDLVPDHRFFAAYSTFLNRTRPRGPVKS